MSGPHSLALGRTVSDTDPTGAWRTPRPDLRVLEGILDTRWAVDLAAETRNTVAPRWYGPDHPDPERRDGADPAVLGRIADDVRALRSPGAAWANPPYSSWGRWARQLSDVWCGWRTPGALLAFARTDTVAWHDAARTATAILFRKGRFKFDNPDGSPGKGSAPAPSAVLWWGPPVADLDHPALAQRHAEVGWLVVQR